LIAAESYRLLIAQSRSDLFSEHVLVDCIRDTIRLPLESLEPFVPPISDFTEYDTRNAFQKVFCLPHQPIIHGEIAIIYAVLNRFRRFAPH